jgi:3-oxoacyl-[acyl-carrier-protein] synthase-3
MVGRSPSLARQANNMARNTQQKLNVKIVGLGRYVPERIETAEELAPRAGVSAEWIKKHTGVVTRHVCTDSIAQMGARAGKQALGDGGPPDLIISASAVPHQLLPENSVFIQRALGFEGIPSFTINSACLSFPVALHNAASLIQVGAYQRVLIVSSEFSTRGRNFKEPASACLFGDGAGAVVVERTPDGEESAILGFEMSTWPEGADLTELRGGGTRQHPQDATTTDDDNLFHMNGPIVYKLVHRRIPPMLRNLYEKSGLTAKDIDIVVPHQTSGHGVDTVSRFGFPPEIVVKRVHEDGNCVAASIPMALAYAYEQGRIKRGNNVFLTGTGAGLTVIGLLMRW